MAADVGQAAPEFNLYDNDRQQRKLSDFKGQNVVLAFYPFDWSPVCTNENCAITGDIDKFDGKDTVVFGISADSTWSHKAWQEKLGLKHDLLSDLKREVIQQYGLYLEDFNCSKRATVVVDKEGKVSFKKVQEIRQERSNQEIIDSISG